MSNSREEISQLSRDIARHLSLDGSGMSDSEKRDVERLALDLYLDGYRKDCAA